LSTAADPYASTDATIVQLRDLFVSLGKDLVKEHAWSQLTRPAVYTTTAGLPLYSLPPSFDRHIPQTVWDRSNDVRPGPIGGPEFQRLKAWGLSTAGYIFVRFTAQGVSLYPDSGTPGGVEFAFEYVSSYWVAATGLPTLGTKEAPTLSSDVPLYDEELLVKGLKLYWRREKGFDAVEAERAYNSRLEKLRSADAPGGVLSMNRRENTQLLGEHNIPPTGWGT
jgi:hypothetical protein